MSLYALAMNQKQLNWLLNLTYVIQVCITYQGQDEAEVVEVCPRCSQLGGRLLKIRLAAVIELGHCSQHNNQLFGSWQQGIGITMEEEGVENDQDLY